ncbi:hypothetical protein [Methylobacterium sp. J-070]|uniref:hypothetical protein n=1 Tax=Methylobacterium sp. J-070 TaxID=2836650 RepID=UPI001FB88D31|nr:hypothetical protein [Methylobacterium sp. J-070]MCJ2049770.1 hypothetical protein [Methylobacterium sp. J-070]
MKVETRILVADALPPLTLAAPCPRRIARGQAMPRLGRILCVAAALALPALGIAVADTVHRVGASGAPQAAAPVVPSDGAAAPSGAVAPARVLRIIRTAALPTRRGEMGA